MCKLSIVVSIYNIEKYLDRCIKSLIKQSNLEYEILLIDDGSTDESSNICQRYAEKYKNIRYLYKENGGLSSARNYGLLKSIGEYIFFVDGDDYIEENCLKDIILEMQYNDLEVLHINYKQVDEEGSILKRKNLNNKMDDRIYNGSKWIEKINFIPMAWTYIFKKDFLINNQLYYLEGIYHEDTEFSPKVIATVQRIKYYKTPIYNYVIREGSIIRSFNVKKAYDLVKIIDSLQEYKEKHILENNIKVFIENRQDYLLIASIKTMLQYGQSIKELIKNTNITYYKINKLIKSKKIKYKILGFIIKFRFYKLLK